MGDVPKNADCVPVPYDVVEKFKEMRSEATTA